MEWATVRSNLGSGREAEQIADRQTEPEVLGANASGQERQPLPAATERCAPRDIWRISEDVAGPSQTVCRIGRTRYAQPEGFTILDPSNDYRSRHGCFSIHQSPAAGQAHAIDNRLAAAQQSCDAWVTDFRCATD